MSKIEIHLENLRAESEKCHLVPWNRTEYGRFHELECEFFLHCEWTYSELRFCTCMMRGLMERGVKVHIRKSLRPWQTMKECLQDYVGESLQYPDTEMIQESVKKGSGQKNSNSKGELDQVTLSDIMKELKSLRDSIKLQSDRVMITEEAMARLNEGA